MERAGVRPWRRLAGALVLVVVAASAAGALSAPARVRVFTGVPSAVPLSPVVRAGLPDEGFPGQVIRQGSRLKVLMGRPGRVRVDLLLWGQLPIGPLVVDVVPPLRLVPGGQAIGVLLAGQGLVVDRVQAVRDPHGHLRHPGRDAGLQEGDIVLEAQGRPLSDPGQLAALLQEAGRRGGGVTVKVRREGRTFITTLRPVREGCGASGRVGTPCEGRFSMGLVLRDPGAGVGTLTFVDPATRLFGALGHGVQDRQHRPVSLEGGVIVAASISSITPGEAGRPGEKLGVFRQGGRPLGYIRENTPVGIFGRLSEHPLPPGAIAQPLPVALSHVVAEGRARLLTVVEGERVEAFDVEVVRIRPPGVPPSQRLLLRVVDPRLLARTAGIVQGMSGSPIIQADQLVGAVTHVSVQDPARGYGVLIEDMLERSGLWGSAAGAAASIRNTTPSARRRSDSAALSVGPVRPGRNRRGE